MLVTAKYLTLKSKTIANSKLDDSQRHQKLVLFLTRKHSTRMHTVRFSDYGGLPTETSWTETTLEGTWDQAARQEVTSYRENLPPFREHND